jgi:hypothetical protein
MKKLYKLDCVQQLTHVEGRCVQPVRIVVKRWMKPKPDKRGKLKGKFYPSEYAKDGLCYYHWKKKKGLIAYGITGVGMGRKW